MYQITPNDIENAYTGIMTRIDSSYHAVVQIPKTLMNGAFHSMRLLVKNNNVQLDYSFDIRIFSSGLLEVTPEPKPTPKLTPKPTPTPTPALTPSPSPTIEPEIIPEPKSNFLVYVLASVFVILCILIGFFIFSIRKKKDTHEAVRNFDADMHSNDKNDKTEIIGNSLGDAYKCVFLSLHFTM